MKKVLTILLVLLFIFLGGILFLRSRIAAPTLEDESQTDVEMVVQAEAPDAELNRQEKSATTTDSNQVTTQSGVVPVKKTGQQSQSVVYTDQGIEFPDVDLTTMQENSGGNSSSASYGTPTVTQEEPAPSLQEAMDEGLELPEARLD